MVLILGNKIENWMKFFISSVGTFPDLPPHTFNHILLLLLCDLADSEVSVPK